MNPLLFTQEKPKVPGYYWRRYKGVDPAITKCDDPSKTLTSMELKAAAFYIQSPDIKQR